ncbi:flagellar filament capping protein FliD [Paenibacillus sp. YIM B09110]|uniref:flagellar filament capping protein FliD n=1 Tax=Paenibacillus sp. YIM B09110 TaxID=3126102 RepID=UPI00301CBBF2
MRLSGLASGLDVDSMVKELMKARQSSYTNLVKKRTLSEWKQEDYRSISTKIVDFRNNKLTNYNMSNAISAKTSQVSGDTNALTINSTSSTATGTISVEVTNVASTATELYSFSDPTQNVALKDLGFTAELDGSNNPTGNVVIKINDKTLSISEDATLSELASFINTNSAALKTTAVYAYDANTGVSKLSLTGTKTGNDSLKIDAFATSTGFSEPKKTISVGSDASIVVNGISYTSNNNRFAVNGMDFTVKAKTAVGNPSTITAVQDTSKIIDTIKSFVADYNNIISSVNSELSEARNRTFSPLTSDEKAEMNEDDVKNWQDKARSGTLRNDSTLSRFVSDLRLAATSLVSGIKDSSGNSIQIGITTGSYSEKGKLVLDESKLRSALESNPEEVISLFSNNSTGVFKKMTTTSMDALTELSKKAGTSLTSTDLNSTFLVNSSLSTEINQMKLKETDMVKRLTRLETQYYKQFTAMETAINKFNSQSGSLSSFM